MLNHIVLMGRLCRDPELRYTPGNTAVCSFRIAVERDYADKAGEKPVDYIDCAAWAHTAEFVSRYFGKGSMICVDGRLEMRTWQEKDGKNRVSAEVRIESAYFAGGGRRERDERMEDPEDPRDDTSLPDAMAIAGGFREIEDGELPL